LMARTKRAGCVCTANTNGTLLDHEKVDALVAMGFDELRVTTMAGTAQTYERTHPGSRPGTFDSLKESLLALAERKAATGSARPRLVLVCVVVQQNHEGLLDFARLAHEVKAQCVVVHPVGDADDPDMAPLVLTDAQAEAVRRQLPELAGYLEERGIRHNLARFALIFQRQLDTRALYRLIPCYMGWLWVQVQADGYVLPCCRCSRPLGNVHDAPMPAIWHGAAYNAFRRAAGLINRRGTPVEACGCDNCANNGANLRAYRILHPGSRRLRALERECAFVDGDGE
jgi:MoaA/NifB/PqqE/SkfB family radical SAM enzyme